MVTPEKEKKPLAPEREPSAPHGDVSAVEQTSDEKILALEKRIEDLRKLKAQEAGSRVAEMSEVEARQREREQYKGLESHDLQPDQATAVSGSAEVPLDVTALLRAEPTASVQSLLHEARAGRRGEQHALEISDQLLDTRQAGAEWIVREFYGQLKRERKT
jgi:hypothetical protein